MQYKLVEIRQWHLEYQRIKSVPLMSRQSELITDCQAARVSLPESRVSPGSGARFRKQHGCRVAQDDSWWMLFAAASIKNTLISSELGYRSSWTTYLIHDNIEPLPVNLQRPHLLKHYLCQHSELVVISIDGQQDTVSLGVEGVTQSSQFCLVRILDEGISDELSKESRLNRVEWRGVDERTVR